MAQDGKSSNWKTELREWLKALGTVGIATAVIYVFLGAPYAVQGESMSYTLHNEEKLIVNKAVYHIQQPKRGDIVIFHANEEEDYIKRVIGIPGDTVEVRNDVLYVSGEPVEEPYLSEKREEAQKDGERLTEDFKPVKVPKNHVFVMGDNRRNSKDSRMIGPVRIEEIVGRAEIVYWPLTNIRLTK